MYPLLDYNSFSITTCDTPRIHHSLPEYPNPPTLFLPLYSMLPESTSASQNILTFQQLQVYVILPECTPLSQNKPLFQHVTFSESTLPFIIYPPSFSTIICVAPRIYPPPPSQNPPTTFYHYMRRSQNLPLPLKIYFLFNNCM